MPCSMPVTRGGKESQNPILKAQGNIDSLYAILYGIYISICYPLIHTIRLMRAMTLSQSGCICPAPSLFLECLDHTSRAMQKICRLLDLGWTCTCIEWPVQKPCLSSSSPQLLHVCAAIPELWQRLLVFPVSSPPLPEHKAKLFFPPPES